MTTKAAKAGGLHPPARAPARSVSFFGRMRIWLAGAVAAFLGLLPHLLHHAGPLAGAALFAGVGGSLLFGAVGMIAAIPFMLRLRRRSGGWRLPAAAMSLFVIVFSISTFVIGPAINGSESSNRAPAASPDQNGAQPPAEGKSGHEAHH